MKLIGNISFKGDKSISHRAIMLASICNGKSIIANVPDSEDINSTISALRNCGISIKKDNYQLTIVMIIIWQWFLLRLDILNTKKYKYGIF